MGLGGGKIKRKIGKDPNNTKWSRNADSFGQKILRSQGWEPGQYLGAQNAAHAEFHTAANASHIRVLLKDNNFGLGAKRNQNDECTGLDVFKDLLGRLNGKSEVAIEEERKAREDTKMTHYVMRKFGPMRFVEGGLLVGDKLEDLVKDQKSRHDTPAESAEASTVEREDERLEKPRKEKKSKKRKASEEATTSADDRELRKEKKRRKKERKEKAAAEDEAVDETSTDAAQATLTESRDETRSASPDVISKSKKTKKDKKAKRDKKDKKRHKSKEAAADTGGGNSDPVDKPSSTEDADTTSASESKSEQPVTTVRNIARKRFIAHKRLAFQDQQALNQIFMIKA